MTEAPPRRRALGSTDLLHLVVLFILALLSTLTVRRTGAGWYLPSGYVLAGGVVVALALLHRSHPESSFLRGSRLVYPFLAVLGIFWSLYWMVHAVAGDVLRDDLLVHWDRTLLGFDPVGWVRNLESPPLTDIMHLFYVSYFFLPLLLLLPLLPERRRSDLQEAIFVLCLSFYLCYAGYLAVPATGPRYFVYGSNLMDGWIVTQTLRDVINFLEPNKADVFPSAHAAVTLVITVLALRFVRPLGYVAALLAVGILASLVYARYHYVIDVLAGVLWAAVALSLGPFLHRQWEKKDHEPAEAL